MKRNIRLLALLLAIISLFSISSDIFAIPADAAAIDSTNVSTKVMEEKVYSQATIEDDFSGKGILIVLTSEATKEFKTYSPDNFSYIPVAEVRNLTATKAEAIQAVMRNDGAVSRLSTTDHEYTENDIEKFKTILYLELENESKENVLSLIKELEKNEDFLYVGPDYYMQVCAVPNDAGYSQQWGLSQIHAPDAWDIEKTASVVVGIVDSGIQGNHPDLINRVNNSMHRDFTTGVTNGTVVTIENLVDPNGHGTHVAGIVGAQTDNTSGCAGVCWDVALVSLRVANAQGQVQISHVINAINYAEDMDIDILNLSLGFYGEDAALETAVGNYNGLIVAAAGNENINTDETHCYPANFNYLENVISVGASDSDDKRSNWNNSNNLWGLLGNKQSNYGKTTVDVFAPGTDIYSTFNTGGYVTMSGTSMAAPFVTGVAALMMSVNESLNPIDIKVLINVSADKVDALKNLCVSGGRLDAYEAIDRAVNAKRVMIVRDSRYCEETATITQAGGYIDYILHFRSSCNRVIQTFGTKDTYLELYASDGTMLLGKSDTDDDGYSLNGLLSYEFDETKIYILRVKFYSASATGGIRVGIVPTYHHDKYESAYGPYGINTWGWSLSTKCVALFRYKFSSSGNVTFTMSSNVDTHLYVIDPTSTEPIVWYTGSNFGEKSLYDDNSAGSFQAQVTKTVTANKEYLVIISFRNPSYMSGEFKITTTQS